MTFELYERMVMMMIGELVLVENKNMHAIYPGKSVKNASQENCAPSATMHKKNTIESLRERDQAKQQTFAAIMNECMSK